MIGQKGIATDAGGIEKHVEKISEYMVHKKNRVIVYYRSTFDKRKIDVFNGVDLKKVKTVNIKCLNAIIYTVKATIDALMNKYDIFHYHGLGPASLCFIPKIFKKRTIVTIHGYDYKRDKWGRFAKIYLHFGEYVACNCADMVIAVSKVIETDIIRRYRKRNKWNTVFIENGCEFDDTKEDREIKKYSLKKDGYMLFVGRLTPEKGIHYLIDAYKNMDTNIKLVIAGGSSFTDNYVKMIKNKAAGNKNIIFTGNVHGELLKELYKYCLFFILPSQVEGMSLALLEALSYGKYCVVSDIKENMSVICKKQLGTGFQSGNSMDLKEKLNLVIKEKPYETGSNIRKTHIKNQYSWEIAAEKTLNLYKKLEESSF